MTGQLRYSPRNGLDAEGERRGDIRDAVLAALRDRTGRDPPPQDGTPSGSNGARRRWARASRSSSTERTGRGWKWPPISRSGRRTGWTRCCPTTGRERMESRQPRGGRASRRGDTGALLGLSSCLEYSRQSDGAFDITVGALMKVWGFYKGEGSMPRRAEVTDALTRWATGTSSSTRTPNGQIHPPRNRARPRRDWQGLRRRPDGDVLKREGVDAALVSASGSSIYGLGAPPDDSRGWAITIRRPREPEQAAATVFLRDMSLSTSGSYEKFFWAGDAPTRTSWTPAPATLRGGRLPYRCRRRGRWTARRGPNRSSSTAAPGPARTPAVFRVFFCDEGSPAVCSWI